jgi:hypothetical protein
MATLAMCLPYEELESVETKIERVHAGLTFSQKMNLVVKACFSLVHLTGAFHEAVTGQAELIDVLLDPRVQGLQSGQLKNIACKLDHLVEVNYEVVQDAASFNFNKPWKGYLDTLSHQAERMAAIAESFHMGADAAITTQMVQLAVSAADEIEGATKTDWREFVAALQD